VPPVPNLRSRPGAREPDLSKGGRYDVEYAIHLAAGFGSQIALTLTRRIPAPSIAWTTRGPRAVAGAVSGHGRGDEVVKRVLRVKSPGGPRHAPAPSAWRFGLGR